MHTGRAGWLGTRVVVAFLAVAAVAASLALAMPALSEPVPTLETDKPDYAPGEVVHITGDGFEPNQTYAVPVKRPNGSIVKWNGTSFEPGWDTATADGSGNLSYDYQLNGVEGTLRGSRVSR